MTQNIVSIIVPVYNTEKYIERCIRSICSQTYKSLEIIVINDGSEENEEAIILKLCEEDTRIKYWKHEKNEGLYQTRIDGVEHSTGNYIAFVDSDDYIGIDFVRLLVNEAEEKEADIVFATTVIDTSQNKRSINILQHTSLNLLPMTGEELRRQYFMQGGEAYVWHTIWNKLYKRVLWNEALPELKLLKGHVVMTEDLAFSTVLFTYVQKAARAENSIYFYCQHEGASTNLNKDSLKNYNKKLCDIKHVFDFIQVFLEKHNSIYNNEFCEFRKYYGRLWMRGTEMLEAAEEERKTAQESVAKFCHDRGNNSVTDDGYFLFSQSPFCEQLDYVKREILNSNQTYISFDIFDTAVVRPFYDPKDLFYLLDKAFAESRESESAFHTIRIEGERAARELYCKEGIKEDITLGEIYKYIEKTYGISNEICKRLMNLEQMKERSYCTLRKVTKELYDIALIAGKKIVFISDMYLNTDTLGDILNHAGYTAYEKIFVSSEYEKTKHTGKLFKYVLNELGISGKDLIHIGDNYKSDISTASKLGIHSIYLPKTKDIFENKLDEYSTNKLALKGKEVAGLYRTGKSFEKINGYGAAIAIVANSFFDNPFKKFHPMTDYNTDPYITGYYALGMHVLGQILWLKKVCEQKNTKRIIFMARDGYLLYKVYQITSEYNFGLPHGEYRYASRKAMLPLLLETKTDFMNLPIVYTKYSPDMILELLNFCTKRLSFSEYKEQLRIIGLEHNKKFLSISQYHNFMKLFWKRFYNRSLHDEQKRVVIKYWQDIEESDLIFDMGYSASIHYAVTKACKSKPVAAFVHVDQNKHKNFQRKGNFDIEVLYDFEPSLSGLLREYFFSDTDGSCISYQLDKQKVIPIKEKSDNAYTDVFPIKMIQKGALDFINVFFKTFATDIDALDFRIPDLIMPFEGFLCAATKADTRMFMCSYFEDRVYGAADRLNVRDFWLENLMYLGGIGGKTIAETFQLLMLENGKKKLAFWGTGKMCRDILDTEYIEVGLFLDNDIQKRGKKWYGSEIICPDDVINWKEIFIVIACGQYQEIEEQLDSIGLVKFQDYVTYMDIC